MFDNIKHFDKNLSTTDYFNYYKNKPAIKRKIMRILTTSYGKCNM